MNFSYIYVERDIIKKKQRQVTKKKVCERYLNLSEKENEEKQRYDRERYRKFPENEKHKLLEYRENYYKTLESVSYFFRLFFNPPELLSVFLFKNYSSFIFIESIFALSILYF